MQPFPSLQWLQLIHVPPSTIDDFPYLQNNLIRLEIMNAGVNELTHLFGSPTKEICGRLKKFRRNYTLNSKSAHSDSDHDRGQDSHAVTGSCGSLTFGSRNVSGLIKKKEPITFVLPIDEFMETRGSKQINQLWPNLLFLRLQNCGLTHLDSSLYLLPFVKQVDVSGNSISNFKHLKGCLNLRIANLSHNLCHSLIDIGSSLASIQRLNLSHNRIHSLQGIDQLLFLEKLDLSNNRITHADEVQFLVKLSFLEDVVLSGNPMAAMYADVNTEACAERGQRYPHRHPLWERFQQHQHRITQQYASLSTKSPAIRQLDTNPNRLGGGGGLYRLMVFAYFYPEISPTGHFRTREMPCLDGQEITEMENDIIMYVK